MGLDKSIFNHNIPQIMDSSGELQLAKINWVGNAGKVDKSWQWGEGKKCPRTGDVNSERSLRSSLSEVSVISTANDKMGHCYSACVILPTNKHVLFVHKPGCNLCAKNYEGNITWCKTVISNNILYPYSLSNKMAFLG